MSLLTQKSSEMEFDALEREEMEVSENHPEVQMLLREVGSYRRPWIEATVLAVG